MRFFALVLFALQALGQAPAEPANAREWLNRGVQLFKSAKYEDAAVAFQRAADLEPRDAKPLLYLGTARLAMYTPGNQEPANADRARQAETAFQMALQIEPENRVALSSLAGLYFGQRRFDEADRHYRKIVEVSGSDREALYSLGVIAWSKVYPDNQRARQNAGMRPEDPGPIRDANLRISLKSQHGPTIEEGMSNLRRAIDIDPQYDDAMAYLNLLYRQAADLRDTGEDYTRDIAEADNWVQRALQTKKAKASAGLRSGGGTAPPPPPPPGAGSAQAAPVPQRIRVGGNVQSSKLVYKPVPLYPAEAKDARIEGTVRFEALIGKDGAIASLTLVSGHPLLVPAATGSVRQWRYDPTLLNGQPVEVLTAIDVNFTLSQ
jgi:tetratricopeptide (TPR) repeat protein